MAPPLGKWLIPKVNEQHCDSFQAGASHQFKKNTDNDTRYKIQDNFIRPLRKLNVCHKMYHTNIIIIRNCTNDSYSHYLQMTIHSYNRPHIHSQTFLHFTPLRHPRNPIPCRCVLRNNNNNNNNKNKTKKKETKETCYRALHSAKRSCSPRCRLKYNQRNNRFSS